MTQQYIAGQLSSLLAELELASGERLIAVDELRREVEVSPPSMLSRLVREAMDLTDQACWAALEHGDASGFHRYSKIAVALREFGVNSGLLPDT
jgi:hypothetical protein